MFEMGLVSDIADRWVIRPGYPCGCAADAEGKLIDEPTRKFIARQLVALQAWALRLRQ
jgi:hypothetical protein